MIQLHKFCSKNDTRTAIQKPFSIGEWTYATNGHIMVRVGRRGNIKENPQAPTSVIDMFNMALNRSGWKWIDAPEMEAKIVDCIWCAGKTKKNPPRCDECNGTGKTKVASGTTFDIEAEQISLGDIYLELIWKELPKAKIGLHKDCSCLSGIGAPVLIQFTGGEGLLMGRRL